MNLIGIFCALQESDRHGRTSSLLSGPDAKPQVNLEDDDSGTYMLAGRYQTVTGRGWRWPRSRRSLVTSRQPCSTAVA
jgi:hypothetical protein